MRNYFPKRPSGAPLHSLSKLYDVPVGFVTPPILRLNIAYFAVAEGWLLLDIGWFVLFFQQTVGISMGTNCVPLLVDKFLYSYEANFIQSLLSTGKKHLASRFNLTYRHIDDVLSINNPEFENYLGQMYPAELEIKD